MLALPLLVNGNSTRATYTNGVLRVTLPKKPEAKSKRIAISAG
jgi:HSP20 family molecular chaperone IbpA